MALPLGWIEKEVPLMSFVYLPEGVDTSDSKVQGLKVITTLMPISTTPDLKLIAQSSISTSEQTFLDFELIEEPKEIKIGGEEGLRIKFKVTSSSEKIDQHTSVHS